MAYSSTVALKSVFGNARVVVLSCTADGVSGAVQAPGIGYAFSAHLSPVSMTSFTGPVVKVNLSAASATANGSVFVSNITSGDAFYLTVFGRS